MKEEVPQIDTGELTGFQVVKLHYSADPDKDEAWVKKAKADTPSEDWDREMELKPIGHVGNYPVFGDYKKALHEDESLIYKPNGGQMVRGWDFGKVHPCVEFVQVDGVKKNVIGEVFGTQIYLNTFVEQVLQYSQQNFPNAKFVDWVDATGKNEKDNGLPSIKVLMLYGLKPKWRMQDIEEGIQYMKKDLVTLVDGRPAFQLNPKKAPRLAQSMRGSYQRNGKGVVIKDGEYDHAPDAVRYAISGVVTGSAQATSNFYAKIKDYKYRANNPITGR
jgi:hypothetical protein